MLCWLLAWPADQSIVCETPLRNTDTTCFDIQAEFAAGFWVLLAGVVVMYVMHFYTVSLEKRATLPLDDGKGTDASTAATASDNSDRDAEAATH